MTRKGTRVFLSEYNPSRSLLFLKEYKSTWLKTYKRLGKENYLGNSKFKINFFEIRDGINGIVNELTLDDIELYLSKK